VGVAQFRVTVEAEAFDDEGVELAHEEVRQEERPHVHRLSTQEVGNARVKCVAVRARQPRNTLLLDHAVELAAGSAVRIADQDCLVTLRSSRMERLADSAWNVLRMVVEPGGQTAQLDVMKPVGLEHGKDLPRQGPARNDELTAWRSWRGRTAFRHRLRPQ